MKLARSKKAVSPVIATILMVNIALAAGVILFTWSQGLFGEWTSISEIYFQGQRESMEEILVLEDLRFDPDASNYEFNLTVRNVGRRDLYISSIYLNNTEMISEIDLVWDSDGEIVTAESGGLHDGTYHIIIEESLTFAFDEVTSPSLDEDDLVTIVVVTDRGNRLVQEWEASG